MRVDESASAERVRMHTNISDDLSMLGSDIGQR